MERPTLSPIRSTTPELPTGALPTIEDGRPTIDRYAVELELGRGGMGVVYQAWDPTLLRRVALKVLRTGRGASPEDVERFVREARVTARMDHPGLVRVLDLGWDEDRVWFTMDLVQGGSLRSALRVGRRFSAVEAARLGATIASALAYAHAQGLVHRDVKPENILIRASDGRPMLTDFGIARLLSGTQRGLTRPGELLGTPAYMPPEQARGELSRLGPATDIYALGAVLYELATGVPPYDGTGISIVGAMLQGPPPRPSLRNPELPAPLAAIIERAMSREPEDRYESAEVLARELENYVADRPVRAYRERRWRRLRTAARAPATQRLLLAATLALGGVLTLAGWQLQQWHARQERETRAQDRLDALQVQLQALRAAGQVDEAQHLFESFIELPENQGTAALVHAWLARAEGAPLASPDARADLASAYAAASARAEQIAVLKRLGELFAQSADTEPLELVIQSLIDRRAAPEEVDALQLAAHLLRRDLPAAGPLLVSRPGGADLAALLQRLGHATPLPLSGYLFPPADLDGDGTDDLLAIDGGAGSMLPLRVPLGAPKPVPLPPDLLDFNLVSPLPEAGQGATVLVGTNPDDHRWFGTEIWRYTATGLERQARFEDTYLLSAAAGDLDRDGLREIYLGTGPYAPDLLRATDTADGWQLTPATREVAGLLSNINKMRIADLDGDGGPELVIAPGAWTAFDLRVYRGPEAPGGPLRPVARQKFGQLYSLAVLPGSDGAADQILLSKPGDPDAHEVFPAAAPFGLPLGVYRVALEQGRLNFVPQQMTAGVSLRTLESGQAVDLDGDGRHELVFTVHSFGRVTLGVFKQRGPDAWSAIWLGGTRLLGTADLDQDGAGDLIVRLTDGAVLALGVGDQTIPRLASAPAASDAVGHVPLRDPELDAASRRAAELTAMGLTEEAAPIYGRLARLAVAPEDQVQMQIREAQTWEQTGAVERAADAWERASAQASPPREALEGAVRSLMALHRFEEAQIFNQQLLSRDALSAETRAQAEAWAGEIDEQVAPLSVSLNLAAGGQDDLIVLDPLGVRLQPGRGMSLRLVGGGAQVAEIPLRCGGPRVSIEGTVEYTRTEWGSGLSMMLRDVRSEDIGVLGYACGAGGGGGLYQRSHRCGPLGRAGPDLMQTPLPAPDNLEKTHFLMDVHNQDASMLCRIEREGAGEVRIFQNLARQVPAGDYVLEFGSPSYGDLGDGVLTEADVRELTIRGCELRAGLPRDALQAGWRALVEGRPRVALEVLGPLPLDQTWDARASALMELGRMDEALQLILSRPRDAQAARLPALFRGHPDLMSAWVGRLGPGGLVDVARVLSGPLHHHPQDQVLQRALQKVLGSAGPPTRAVSAPVADAWATFLLHRGNASLRAGAYADAVEAANGALEVTAGQINLGDPVSAPAPLAHLLLARVAAREGDAERARESVARARALSHYPEIIGDRVAAADEFQSYVGRPEWAALIGP